MAKEQRYRWRTSPHVIGQYVMDKHIPKGSHITLKPNEACLVVEKGRVAGTATQTNMEVNPEAGLLSKMFGSGTPERAFFFVLLGPHDVLIRITGRTKDGHDVSGCVGLKVEFNIQNLGRLLSLPAKGEMTIGVGDLGRMLFNEVNATINTEIVGSCSLEELRSDSGLREDAEAGLRMALRATFDSLALDFKGAWLSWEKTEHEKLLSMQDELDLMKQRNEVVDETANEEMQVMLRNRARQAELLHSMHVQDLNVAEKQKIAAEVAQLQARNDLESARWEVISSKELRQQQHTHQMDEAERGNALAAAKNDAEISNIQNQVELNKEQQKMDIAMSAFEQVQAAKRAREAQRMDHISDTKNAEMGMMERMLEKGFDTGATDSNVLQEMLRSQAAAKEHEASLTGKAFETQAGPPTCPSCNAQIQSSWVGCPMCGQKL